LITNWRYTKRPSKPTIGPVEFIDRVIERDEKGQPFRLAAYQRQVLEMALRRNPSGEFVFRLVVLSKRKKSGAVSFQGVQDHDSAN